MSSTAESPAHAPEQLSPDAMWAAGEVFAHHPRVRRAHIAGRAVTIHRFRQAAPGGITCLAVHPALSELAGLRLLAEGYYVLDFVEGDLLDAVEPGRALVDPLASALGRVWASPVESFLPAAREQPIVGPVTRRQYVEMPDAVLASAHEYGALAVELRALLDARGPGDTFVHGDLKADNAVRTPAGDARFIDWECCGLGHAEDDVASLLASLCVYALGRAVRRSASDAALGDNVSRELSAVQDFSTALLNRTAQLRPRMTMNRLGEAFLLSSLCRLQGLLFVPTSEAVRLAVDEFVRRSFREGPDAVSVWLRGAAGARPEASPC